MTANNKPHIELNPLPDTPKRKKSHGGGSASKRENYVEHSDRILSKIDKLQSDFREKQDQNPLMRPTLVFKIKAKDRLQENDLLRSGLRVLDEDRENQYVVFADDGDLDKMASRVKAYGQPIPEGNQNPTYNSEIAPIDDVLPRSREERLGKRLRNAILDATKKYKFDIEYYNEAVDDSKTKLNTLNQVVEQLGGRVLDSFDRNNILMARIEIRGEYLDNILTDDDIKIVNLPPEPDLRYGDLLNHNLADLPSPISPQEDAIGLCIIDSGIVSGHPLLKTAVGDTKSIPADLHSQELHPHGTSVAGIALYGDVAQAIENKEFRQRFHIFSARVLNNNNRFDEEKLIVSQMEESIRVFHDTYKCRIFNLSLGSIDDVFDGVKKPSPWANILDELARELDIVIIVSAGNISFNHLDSDGALRIFKQYPSYLIDGVDIEGDTRIVEPATAANVITVGSLAHRIESFRATRYEDVDVQPIANESYPSPFTRIGWGVNDAIKPDVCEYGGNMVWNGRNGRISKDSYLGIISMHTNWIDRLFSTDVGTSMAAPKVAYLAARILEQYPDASANLVRALIANSASIPSSLKWSDEPSRSEARRRDLRIFGYGKPCEDIALYSSDNRVTLFAQKTAILDTIQLYQIPIPEDFKVTSGVRAVIVSLAYDPPIRSNRRDYLAIGMEFDLFRGVSANDVIQWYKEHENGENVSERAKIAGSSKCKLEPTKTERSKGTLQKAVWTTDRQDQFTNYLSDDNSHLYLMVQCKAKSGITQNIYPTQRYAIVITLQHSDETITLYNQVKQSVQKRVQIRG